MSDENVAVGKGSEYVAHVLTAAPVWRICVLLTHLLSVVSASDLPRLQLNYVLLSAA